MTVLRETTIHRYTVLSTDSLPTGVPPGSYSWCSDTGTLLKTYDGDNWLAYSVNSVVQPGTVNLYHAAGNIDLFTATGGSVYIEYFSIIISRDCSGDAALTGISIQSDTTTVITLLASAAGVKANLTLNATFTYAIPFALPVGKKIQLTIIGGTATTSPTNCVTSCRYRAIAPAGYLA
jgi:hypothetical protein